MTNKEAIKILKSKMDGSVDTSYEWCEVVRLAINALENERPHGKWIPVNERLPDNETEVLIQFGYSQSMMVGYHIFDYTIYPSGFEDENETGWYDSNDDFIGGTYEVTAWMPLPEAYKGERENEQTTN